MRAKIRWTTWTWLLLASPALAGVWGARDQYLSRLSSGVELDPEMLDRFGEALAVGDFDSDGHADIAVGVPGAVINGDVDAGSVHVLYGSANGFRTDNDDVFDGDSAGIAGDAEPDDRFGSVLAAGDFDGDGFDDLAIGAPAEAIGSASHAGAFWILYGTAGGLTTSGSDDFNQDSTGVPTGAHANEEFGAALAAGDFDHDGYDDLAVSAPSEDRPDCAGGPPEGLVFVFWGASGGLSSTGIQWLDTGVLEGGLLCGTEFGKALAAGDFDNDDYEDLAIADPKLADWDGSIFVSEAGAVYVVAGSASGLDPGDYERWSQEASGVPGGAEPFDHMGEALGIGNFDGNSRADLAIGLPFNGDGVGDVGDPGAVVTLHGSSSLLTASGALFLEQGASGLPDLVETNDRFGNALASGDFDGDGYGDLAIGAAEENFGAGTNAGIVMVVPGSPAGLVRAAAQLISQDFPGVKEDTDTDDEFGRALAVGDVDGDGLDDLVVGLPGQTIGLDSAAGAIHLLFGALFAADFEDGAGTSEWSTVSP